MSIKGFEDWTKPLTEEDKVVATKIFRMIRTYGPVDSGSIRSFVRPEYILTGVDVRRIVHYLRCRQGKKIVATSKGYEITRSRKKLKKYSESLLQRIRSIQEVYEAMLV